MSDEPGMATDTMIRERFPSHVPEHLIWDHDINAHSAEMGDPYLAAARMHNLDHDIV
jgi:hypothetical protein